MAIDITGTNTEKIDKLTAALIELRVTGRIIAIVFAIAFPVLVGVETWLLTQSFSVNGRLERLEERVGNIDRRLDQLDKRLDRMDERLTRIEAKLDKLAERPK